MLSSANDTTSRQQQHPPINAIMYGDSAYHVSDEIASALFAKDAVAVCVGRGAGRGEGHSSMRA